MSELRNVLERHRTPLLLLLLLATLLVALFPEAASGRGFFFERDIHVYGLAQWEVFVRSVAEGSWPVWDPTVSFGRPLLAIPSSQVLYPSTWLHLIVLPRVQYTLFVFGHLLFTGVGLYALARRFGVSRAGSGVAACLWVASGPLLSFLNLWHHFAGSAWLPWVVLAAEAALDSGRLASALVWGGAAAMQLLAGSADLVIFTTVVVAASALRRIVPRAGAAASLLRLLRPAAVAAGFALALAAAQCLPVAELLGRAHLGTRGPLDRAFWSVHPAALWQLLLPISFRELPSRSDPGAVTDLFNLWSPFLVSNHLGLASLALVIVALSAPRRPHRILAGGVAAFALLFSLGLSTPFHAFVTGIPPFTLIRYPSKATILVAFGWALLAGMGFDEWMVAPVAAWRRRLSLAGATAAGYIVAASLLAARTGAGWWPFAGGPAPGAGRWADVFASSRSDVTVAAALGAAALAALAWRALMRPSHAQRLIVAIVAVVELAALHRTLNATAGPEFFSYRPEILESLKGDPPPRLYVFDYVSSVPGHEHAATQGMVATLMDVPTNWPRPLSMALAMQTYLYPPSFSRWGLRGSYDRDLLGLYPRDLYDTNLAVRGLEETPAFLRLQQLGGVEYVVALHTEGLRELLVPVVTLKGLYRRPIEVFRVPDTLPPAYAVAGTRIASGREAFRMLVDPEFDPRREVVLPEGLPRAAPPGFTASVRTLARRSDRVTLEAELTAPGYVVLLDGYDPGWQVSVDGSPAALLPANLLFRAVAVPAGRHRVEMVYRPRALLIGLAISALAFFVGAGLLLRRLVRG